MAKYIKVDDLLAFCENQTDNSITPNDFMRMNHYDFDEKSKQEMKAALNAIEEVCGLMHMIVDRTKISLTNSNSLGT